MKKQDLKMKSQTKEIISKNVTPIFAYQIEILKIGSYVKNPYSDVAFC